MMTLPKSESKGVRLAVKPTVAKAEKASKKISIKANGSIKHKIKLAVATMQVEIKTTATACLTNSSLMLRPKVTTAFLP